MNLTVNFYFDKKKQKNPYFGGSSGFWQLAPTLDLFKLTWKMNFIAQLGLMHYNSYSLTWIYVLEKIMFQSNVYPDELLYKDVVYRR